MAVLGVVVQEAGATDDFISEMACRTDILLYDSTACLQYTTPYRTKDIHYTFKPNTTLNTRGLDKAK